MVKAEAIENRPITNVTLRACKDCFGVSIVASSGQPGAVPNISTIRGTGTINSSTKRLCLIDGVAGDINLLNPSDIESVSKMRKMPRHLLFMNVPPTVLFL